MEIYIVESAGDTVVALARSEAEAVGLVYLDLDSDDFDPYAKHISAHHLPWKRAARLQLFDEQGAPMTPRAVANLKKLQTPAIFAMLDHLED